MFVGQPTGPAAWVWCQLLPSRPKIARRADGTLCSTVARLKDIASAAGVSISVASRVIRDVPNTRISRTTADRILQVAADLNYIPDQRAQSLLSGRTNALSLVVPNVSNAAFADLLTGVEARAHDRGYAVLLAQLENRSAGIESLRTLVDQGRVDGLLVQRREDYSARDWRRAIDPAFPMVFVNSSLPSRPGSVVLDDVEGARVATQHLIDLGHHDIVHLTGPPGLDTADRRRRGYELCMAAAGLAVTPRSIIRGSWEVSSSSAAAQRLLARGVLPTAVFVASVNAAIGLAGHLQRRGVRIPEDLSIVAITTTWVSEAVYPSITTVRMPLRELADAAVDMLVDSFGGSTLLDVVVTDPAPRLEARESTAPPRSS